MYFLKKWLRKSDFCRAYAECVHQRRVRYTLPKRGYPGYSIKMHLMVRLQFRSVWSTSSVPFSHVHWSSQLGLQNTLTASLDMTILWKGFSNAGASGNAEYPLFLLLLGPLWPGVVEPNMGQIELNCVIMLNWIVWNRTVLTFNCV